MWEYWIFSIIHFSATLAAEMAIPLEAKPTKFKDIEGCYIKELDKMIKVGENTNSAKECYTYLCGENEVILIGCEQFETSPLCRITENKSLSYPECCPNFDCVEKPVLKSITDFNVFGVDLLNKNQSESSTNEKQNKSNVNENKVTMIKVLKIDLLNKKKVEDGNKNARNKKKLTGRNGQIKDTIATNHAKEQKHKLTQVAKQRKTPEKKNEVSNKEIKSSTVSETRYELDEEIRERIAKLKEVSMLGVDILNPSSLNLWGKGKPMHNLAINVDNERALGIYTVGETKETKKKEEEITTKPAKRNESDILVFFKRAGE